MHPTFFESLSFIEMYLQYVEIIIKIGVLLFFYSAHQWFPFSARETATTAEFIQTFMEEFSPP